MSFFKKLFSGKNKVPDSVFISHEDIQNISYGNQIVKIPLDSLSCDEYKGLTFLIVDDDIDQQNILSTFLKTHGAVVDFACNGKTAVEMYIHAPGKYKIIFMDFQMPVMCGDEAAMKIRESNTDTANEIPIVAITGNTNVDFTQDSIFNKFIYKPYEMEELAAVIKDLLV